MKRFYNAILVAGLCLSFTVQNSVAQDDLNVFGYFQSIFNQSKRTNSAGTLTNTNTFAVQQLNVFLGKNLNEDFSAFINLEFTNSFSSERNWGGLNLEEAWMKYEHSDAFNVKAGLLIPRFNHLNEIKNKTPLLPYILRPPVYEATLAANVNLEAFAPQRAFVQVNGMIPVGDAKFDYAVYAGNSDKTHINGGTTGQRGVDTTTYKMAGGRIGFTLSDFTIGVSGTYDRDNLRRYNVGDVPRTRVGADLSYSIAGFRLDAEFILVNDKLTTAEQKALDSVANAPKSTIGSGTKKTFYYANLSYDITTDLYAYAQYGGLVDEFNKTQADGVKSLSVGAGYRPMDQVVVKAQFRQLKFPAFGNTLAATQNSIIGGVSVFF